MRARTSIHTHIICSDYAVLLYEKFTKKGNETIKKMLFFHQKTSKENCNQNEMIPLCVHGIKNNDDGDGSSDESVGVLRSGFSK